MNTWRPAARSMQKVSEEQIGYIIRQVLNQENAAAVGALHTLNDMLKEILADAEELDN